MHHACYFAPLSPTKSYPVTSFEASLFFRTYDLPVDPCAAAYMAKEVTCARNEYFRNDLFITASSLRRLREKPHRLYLEATRPAAFAEIITTERIGRGGYVAQILFVSKELAATLLVHAWDRWPDYESPKATDLRQKTDYFSEAGGFELLRAWYWFNADDLNSATLDDNGLPVFDYSQAGPSLLREAARKPTCRTP